MSQDVFSVQTFEAKRVQCVSSRAYDEVLQNFQQVVNTADHTAVLQGFSESVRTREDYEKVVQEQLGESGFMLFFSIDHGRWLKVLGVQRRVMRLILGNPLIAITMMQHDVNAGLFAPVEVLVVENESGGGSTVIYDLPSAQMKIEHNPEMLAAAQELDRKLQILVSRMTGVEVPEQRGASNK